MKTYIMLCDAIQMTFQIGFYDCNRRRSGNLYIIYIYLKIKAKAKKKKRFSWVVVTEIVVSCVAEYKKMVDEKEKIH